MNKGNKEENPIEYLESILDSCDDSEKIAIAAITSGVYIETFISGLTGNYYTYIRDLPIISNDDSSVVLSKPYLTLGTFKIIIKYYPTLSLYGILSNYDIEEIRKEAIKDFHLYVTPLFYNKYNFIDSSILSYTKYNNVEMVEYLIDKVVDNYIYYLHNPKPTIRLSEEDSHLKQLISSSIKEIKYKQDVFDSLELCILNKQQYLFFSICYIVSKRLLQDSRKEVDLLDFYDKPSTKKKFIKKIPVTLNELRKIVHNLIYPSKESINYIIELSGRPEYKVLTTDESSDYILSIFFDKNYDSNNSLYENMLLLHGYLEFIIDYVNKGNNYGITEV